MCKAYLDAVQRIHRMIDRSGPGDHIDDWVQALFNINMTWDGMAEIPYRVVKSRMYAFEAGREVHRLFHAAQLLAEWRFAENTLVTHRSVVIAFNEIGDEGFGDSLIFPDGTASPAAQREIHKLPIFRNPEGRGKWIAEGFDNDPISPTFMVTGYGNVAVTPIPPNVQFDEENQIWDVVRD